MLKVGILTALTGFGLALFMASASATPKKDVNAIRAECFRQANEAANAAGGLMSSGATAARNAAGYSAYRDCAHKNGIRP